MFKHVVALNHIYVSLIVLVDNHYIVDIVLVVIVCAFV
jgi:hypothetical protein